jgi:hypothetical protein
MATKRQEREPVLARCVVRALEALWKDPTLHEYEWHETSERVLLSGTSLYNIMLADCSGTLRLSLLRTDSRSPLRCSTFFEDMGLSCQTVLCLRTVCAWPPRHQWTWFTAAKIQGLKCSMDGVEQRQLFGDPVTILREVARVGVFPELYDLLLPPPVDEQVTLLPQVGPQAPEAVRMRHLDRLAGLRAQGYSCRSTYEGNQVFVRTVGKRKLDDDEPRWQEPGDEGGDGAGACAGHE